jgi:mono/diheme cytochrome c family protein/DNA-binding beta-propeller fold protein YncE
MCSLRRALPVALAALLVAVRPGPAEAADAGPIYARHCASCHGADRLGGMGPALLPESLERLKNADAVSTISQGRAATRMTGFAAILSSEEIASVAAWIYTPVDPRPDWSRAQMSASRIVLAGPGSLPDRPTDALAGVNLLNLFVVVEAGDHHVTILDGDRLEPIERFATHYALHGGPKFTADGRYVYFASRDGWVSKYDLWNLKTVVEIRAGINTRNLAVSSDGKWVMVANVLPRDLVLLDADLNPVREFVTQGLQGGPTSRVSAVYDAAPRHSFVAALKDVPEIWEISYEPAAPPIYAGLVHDYAMGEAVASPGYLNPRRTPLDAVLDDFFFDASYANVMGTSRDGHGQVVNLDARRRIAELDLPGMPHLGSGITWTREGRPVMATPNLKDGVVSVIDMRDWRTVKQVATPGPGYFIRSHDATRYAWVDSAMGPHKDTLTVIDKATLESVAELRPAPGKTLAHVEFTRDGRYALASLSERKVDGGAIIVFDAETLKEVKRIPLDKPVGKYNVFNKVTRSSGTSH